MRRRSISSIGFPNSSATNARDESILLMTSSNLVESLVSDGIYSPRSPIATTIASDATPLSCKTKGLRSISRRMLFRAPVQSLLPVLPIERA